MDATTVGMLIYYTGAGVGLLILAVVAYITGRMEKTYMHSADDE